MFVSFGSVQGLMSIDSVAFAFKMLYVIFHTFNVGQLLQCLYCYQKQTFFDLVLSCCHSVHCGFFYFFFLTATIFVNKKGGHSFPSLEGKCYETTQFCKAKCSTTAWPFPQFQLDMFLGLCFERPTVAVLLDISAGEQLGSVNGCGKVFVAVEPALCSSFVGMDGLLKCLSLDLGKEGKGGVKQLESFYPVWWCSHTGVSGLALSRKVC